MAKATPPLTASTKFPAPMLALHARRPGERGDDYPNMTACLLPIERQWIQRIREVAELIQKDAKSKSPYKLDWVKIRNAPASFLEGDGSDASKEEKRDPQADLGILTADGHVGYHCKFVDVGVPMKIIESEPLEDDGDLSLDGVSFIVIPGAQAEKCGSLTDARSAVFWVSDNEFYIAGTTNKYDDLDAESEILPLSALDVLEAQLGTGESDAALLSHGLLATLQDACDALDDLDRGADEDTRHERQLDGLEKIAGSVVTLLMAGMSLADIQNEVREAEDLFNGHYGELGDTDLPPSLEARFQVLPGYFDDLDSLKNAR